MKERQQIEWKQSWRDECLKWICGFANAEVMTLAEIAIPIAIEKSPTATDASHL